MACKINSGGTRFSKPIEEISISTHLRGIQLQKFSYAYEIRSCGHNVRFLCSVPHCKSSLNVPSNTLSSRCKIAVYTLALNVCLSKVVTRTLGLAETSAQQFSSALRKSFLIALFARHHTAKHLNKLCTTIMLLDELA